MTESKTLLLLLMLICIQQECIKLIKCERKDFYIVTKKKAISKTFPFGHTLDESPILNYGSCLNKLLITAY